MAASRQRMGTWGLGDFPMMKPAMQLQKGEVVRNKRLLNDAIIKHWRYAGECASLGGGLMPGSSLSVLEVGKADNVRWWIKLEIPGRFPSASLKVSGEELGLNFDMA
jgi:hypothetical protein